MTLSHSAVNSQDYCQANVGKWSGVYITTNNSLLYYELTPNHTINNISVGVSGLSTLPGATRTTGSPNFLGGNADAVGYQVGTGGVEWAGTPPSFNAGTGAYGVTAAVVVNMKSDPWQFWVTPNITSLTCSGTGSSGSTHPKWNGSCAADPSLSGTGIPMTPSEVGYQFNLPGYEAFPAVTLNQNDALTFNFSDDATLDLLLPSGYQAWNNNQGETAPNISPSGTLTINIANAPGWQASTTYTASSSGIPRVLAGAGWNGSAFVSGSPLCLFALKAGSGRSSGTSASAFNTACASGTPANVGGGVTTATPPSSWDSATTVTDGALTWVLLAQGQGTRSTTGPLLYPTISAANGDDAQTWHTSSGSCRSHGPGCYWFNDYVINNGNIYEQFNGGTTLCATATSGSGPTGTTAGRVNTDNGCQWFYRGPLVYSPRSYLWPHRVVSNGVGSASEATYGYNVNLQVWWGGPSRTSYVNGSGNEVANIAIGDHLAGTLEQNVLCAGSGVTAFLSAFPWAPNVYNCMGFMAPQTIMFAPAPGDGFNDNITASSGPLSEANGASGVLVTSSQVFDFSKGFGGAIIWQDQDTIVSGMQFSSSTGQAFIGCCSNVGPTIGVSPGTNANIFNQNIFQCEGSSANFCISFDASNQFTNNLVIDNITTTASMSIWSKYPGPIANNTFITPSGTTNKTVVNVNLPGAGVFNSGGGGYFPPVFANNYYFGYANCWVYGQVWPSTSSIVNNGGDITSCPVGGMFTDPYTGNTVTQASLNGTVGLSASTELVNPTIGRSLDARIKSTSATGYGRGQNYSQSIQAGSFWGTAIVPGPDILGTSRTSLSRVDIGAAAFVSGGGPPPGVGGGRSLFH